MKTHLVIKSIIDKNLSNFLHNYLLEKKEVHDILRDIKYLSPFCEIHGKTGDPQIPGSYCIYGDVAMDSLLPMIMPIIEDKLKLKLVPTYSYARAYKKGDTLHRHKDRPSCEISTTLNLGGDPWPIFIDGTGADSVINERQNLVKPDAPKGEQVLLEVGDM